MMEVDSEEYTNRAIEYFRKALDLSPQAWVAMEGLAVCYGTNLGDYSTAVQIMNDALRNLPSELGVEFHLRAKMGNWLRQLDDLEEYLRVTRLNFEESRNFPYWSSNPVGQHHTMLTIKNYIEALYRSRDFDGLLDAIHELDSRPTGEDNITVWLAFLQAQLDDDYDIDLFDKLGALSRAPNYTHVVEFLDQSVQRAADLRTETIAVTTNQWMAKMGAEWLSTYSTQEHARGFCELVIQLINQSDSGAQQEASWLYKRIANMLGALYFKDAFTTKQAGCDTVSIVDSMRGLALHQQGSQQYYRATYPAMLLGLWLHEYGGASESEWMAAITPSVLRALYLLSDDDPWNDQDAYGELGAALLYANDVDNAQIALGITMKPIEDAQNKVDRNEDNEQDDTAKDEVPNESMASQNTTTDVMEAINEKYAGFILRWSCDGTCDKEQNEYRQLHFCRFCWDVCFCEDCLPLVKNEEISTVCSKDHEHVQIFPMSSDAKRIADALVEKRYEEQVEWLEELKQRWGA